MEDEEEVEAGEAEAESPLTSVCFLIQGNYYRKIYVSFP